MSRYPDEMVEWLTSWDRCWRCRRPGLWPNMHAHHFIRGSARHQNDRKTIAMLCFDCHAEEHVGKDPLGVLGCLALKRHYDLENYDPAHCCRVAGKAETCWTGMEVRDHASLLVLKGIIP